MVVRFKRLSIASFLVRMCMCNNSSIIHNMGVQKNCFVENKQSHQANDKDSKSPSCCILNGELHHAAKVVRFLI